MDFLPLFVFVRRGIPYPNCEQRKIVQWNKDGGRGGEGEMEEERIGCERRESLNELWTNFDAKRESEEMPKFN